MSHCSVQMRCWFCANLSIECLIDLAQREFTGIYFPSSAFYQHHASFRDLAESANGGCDLCQLIADTFKGTRWEGASDCSLNDLETSLYAAALTKHPSDVRLAINTSHVYLGESLHKVRVLNTLLIQVGPPDELEDDVDEDALPFLSLSLSTLPERPVEVGAFRIGRFRVDPDLSSAKNFEIARSWLNECREHNGCFTSQVRKLPKRVVDIGPLDAPLNPRILLTHGAEADYIALSHCWGGRIPTLLTAETYDEYQKSLPFHDLPSNFQDALVISRELGIRYIWIDSLCIIQDSKSDWEQESKKMASIYSKATLTVSALASEKSTRGILKKHGNDQSLAPNSASIRVFKDQTRLDQVQIEWKPVVEENFRHLDIEGPLSQRGWCLQEYFLSPSTLLFGSRQIYWRCLRCMKSADGMPEGNEFPESKYRAASGTAFSSLFPGMPEVKLDTLALLQDYYELAQAYSLRSLTYGSDKLPAFSGIAQSLHSAIGGEYLAGLWTTDFNHGLLWESDLKTATHVKPYRAPSWSWLVSDEPILFMRGKRMRPNKLDLQLLRHQVTLDDKTNPFGPISSCHVVVKGHTTPLLRSEKAVAKPDWDTSNGSVNFDQVAPSCRHSSFDLRRHPPGAHSDFTFEYVPRDADQVIFELDMEHPESDLLILLVQAGEDVDRQQYGEVTATGLALRPVAHCERDDTYERIGLVSFQTPKMEWFESWNIQTLVLV